MSSVPFLHQIPFLRLSLSFILGIIAGFLCPVMYLVGFAILALAILALIVSFYIKKDTSKSYNYRWIDGIAIMGIFFGSGFLLFQHTQQQTITTLPIEQKSYIGNIIESPIEKNKSVMVVISLQATDSSTNPIQAILYLQKDSAALATEYGDKILVHVKLERPKTSGNPHEFNYAQFLQRKGIVATAYVTSSKWQKTEIPSSFSLRKTAKNTRAKLLALYKEYGITDNEFGIVAALTVGYKEGLSKETKQSFSATGGSHVLAVSGLHVGIIYIAMSFFLGFLNRHRSSFIFKQMLILLSIWIYAFVCGLPPSVVRAGIMISLICGSEILNRKSATYNAVFFSAFCMLLYNPFYLFDVGFQLSYMAVLSILYFQPRINRLLSPKQNWVQWLWSLTTVSIAAQIGTAPISLYYFHAFPSYFLLTNLLVIPAATLIIYLSMILLLTAHWQAVGALVAWVLKQSVHIVLLGVKAIEQLPMASITDIWIPLWATFMLGLIILLGMVYAQQKRPSYIFAIGIILLISLGVANWNHYAILQDKKLIVYVSQDAPATFNLHRIDGEENSFFTDTSRIESIVNAYKIVVKKRKINEPIIENTSPENHFGVVGNHTYFVYQHRAKWQEKSDKIPITFLFIYSPNFYSISEITKIFAPEQLILGEHIKGKRLQKIQLECNNEEIKCHSLYENGAFIHSL